MEEKESTEIELYEEIVGHLSYGTPSVSPAVSLVDVRELPPSQEPMPYSGNSESSLATTSRSALRQQLAGYPDEPRTVAVTHHVFFANLSYPLGSRIRLATTTEMQRAIDKPIAIINRTPTTEHPAISRPNTGEEGILL